MIPAKFVVFHMKFKSRKRRLLAVSMAASRKAWRVRKRKLKVQVKQCPDESILRASVLAD
jgi:hypothetical protein